MAVDGLHDHGRNVRGLACDTLGLWNGFEVLGKILRLVRVGPQIVTGNPLNLAQVLMLVVQIIDALCLRASHVLLAFERLVPEGGELLSDVRVCEVNDLLHKYVLINLRRQCSRVFLFQFGQALVVWLLYYIYHALTLLMLTLAVLIKILLLI